jgi:hypothetical protein
MIRGLLWRVIKVRYDSGSVGEDLTITCRIP